MKSIGQIGATFMKAHILTGGIAKQIPAGIIAEHVESLSCFGCCDGIIIVIDGIIIAV